MTANGFLDVADNRLRQVVESLVSSEPEQLKSAQAGLEQLVRSFSLLDSAACQEMRGMGAAPLAQFRKRLAGAAVITQQAANSIGLLMGQAGLEDGEGRVSIQVEG